METRKFGNTGMHLTVLGMGGSEIGYHGVPQDTATELINAALDAGLNVIDTAECYANSEELIGNAVSHRRKDFFLFTKCGHDGAAFNLPDWDPGMLEQSIDRSLKRLKTDHVDLLQLHSCTKADLEKGAVIEVVKKAKAAGKTRFIGYSGDGEAALWAVNSGLFDSLQISINIADQEALPIILPAAKRKNMGVIAKRPVANAAWLKNAATIGNYSKPYWERLQQLDYSFLKKPAAEAINHALSFTLGSPGVTTAIVGTTRPGRWKQNADLLKSTGPLTAADYDAIRARWNQLAAPDWVGQT